jgi:CBS domain-containing protein
MATAAPPVFHLSLIVGGELRDASGERLGRVDDLIVRLGDQDYPPVTGVVATVAARQVFVAAEQVVELGPGFVLLEADRLDLQHFRSRPQEVLLKKDVLDRQLINVDGARLVRRVIPRALSGRLEAGGFLDWASVEPFTGHVPTVRLRIPHPKLARLHPAQVADLVEAASHEEGREIIAAVAGDPEREADVFEEVDERHTLEFVEDRSDGEIAELLGRMETDDAADLVLQLPEERREDVIGLLPGFHERRLRALLGYDPATAGGLMSPEFVCVYADATREEALDRVERSKVPADALAWIYGMNTRRRLRGGIALADLVRTAEGERLRNVLRPVQTVRAEADLEEVARLMTDFDLTIVPVVDEDDRILGIVTVDDVLELVLPEPWRRRFGLLGSD